MPFLALQGIPVPVASWSQDDGAAGADGETDTGHLWRSDVGGLRDLYELETAAVDDDEALAWALLLVGAGEVWGESDYGSKGTVLETAMTTSTSAKFGSYRFVPPSAPDDFVSLLNVPGVEDLDDGWTVLLWYDDGGGYVHYGLSSDGTRYQGGAVDATAVLPFSVSTAGMVSFDLAGDYDDVVVLPFVLPPSWIGSLDLTTAWAGLPTLNASGDFHVAAIDVEAIGEVTIKPIKGTLASTVRASLLQVPRRAE